MRGVLSFAAFLLAVAAGTMSWAPSPRALPQPAVSATEGLISGTTEDAAAVPLGASASARGSSSAERPVVNREAAGSTPATGRVTSRRPNSPSRRTARGIQATATVQRPTRSVAPRTGGCKVGCTDPRYGVPWLTRSGIASHMSSGYPSGYLALPHGPGWTARICGAGGCVTMTSNDAGPALYLQRQGRIADLSVAVFESVCGVPASAGLCPVSVSIVGRK